MAYVCTACSAGMPKTLHGVEMAMTSLATVCEWRCLGELEKGVPHQPLPPSEAAALVSEFLSRASPLVPPGKISRLGWLQCEYNFVHWVLFNHNLYSCVCPVVALSAQRVTACFHIICTMFHVAINTAHLNAFQVVLLSK